MPLVCVVPLTETDFPVVVKFATKAVTSVPDGTVAVMLVPLIVAVTSDERAVFVASVKLKAVIALEEEGIIEKSFDPSVRM